MLIKLANAKAMLEAKQDTMRNDFARKDKRVPLAGVTRDCNGVSR